MYRLVKNVTNSVKNLASPSQSSSTRSSSGVQQSADGKGRVLIVGETGSGKSTFINYLTNFFRGGTLKNLRVAIPNKFHPRATENFRHAENAVGDNRQSQTDECTVYAFTDGRGKQYSFLDTPGLCDTRGIKQDEENLNKIITSVIDLGGLSAVIIVINGTTARLTVNMQSVLSQLRGNLPDVVLEDVIVVFTNSTHRTCNFDDRSLQLQGAKRIHGFYMQNSAFSSDQKTWNQRDWKMLEVEWENSICEIKEMIDVIDKLSPKPVNCFSDMRNIRQEIKQRLHEARTEVVRIQTIQDHIKSLESAVARHDQDIYANQNFKTTHYVNDPVLIDTSYHNTLCENCNHVCHEECRLDEVPGEKTGEKAAFLQCRCIENGQCTECQGRCNYTKHYHAKKTIEIQQKSIDNLLHDVQDRYNSALAKKGIDEQEIHSNQDALQLLENAINQQKNEIRHLCQQLKKMCSGFNLTDELHSTIQQLEISAKQLTNVDAKREAMDFARSIRQLCSELQQENPSMDQYNDNESKFVERRRSIDKMNSNDDKYYRRSSDLPEGTTKQKQQGYSGYREDDYDDHRSQTRQQQSVPTKKSSSAERYDDDDDNSRPSPDSQPTHIKRKQKQRFVIQSGHVNSPQSNQGDHHSFPEQTRPGSHLGGYASDSGYRIDQQNYRQPHQPSTTPNMVHPPLVNEHAPYSQSYGGPNYQQAPYGSHNYQQHPHRNDNRQYQSLGGHIYQPQQPYSGNSNYNPNLGPPPPPPMPFSYNKHYTIPPFPHQPQQTPVNYQSEMNKHQVPPIPTPYPDMADNKQQQRPFGISYQFDDILSDKANYPADQNIGAAFNNGYTFQPGQMPNQPFY